MISFSERKNNSPDREALQINSFNEDTNRNLWDVISWFIRYVDDKDVSEFNDKIIEQLNVFFIRVSTNVWKKLREDAENLYNKHEDSYGDVYYHLDPNNYLSLKRWWFNESTSFDNKMDILEFLCLCFYKTHKIGSYEFNKVINKKFKELFVGYRVDSKNQLIPINSDEELESIEQADKETTHINKAVTLLKNGDYPNSVKESILAVEDICKKFLGDNAKNTLGKNLIIIKKRSDFHPAFIEILEKLYFTSCNAKDVRHIGNDESAIEQEEAHFILITCSAFINYLKEKERNSSK